jgi:NTP pyrophosphatase (non-canonical NTP hydrolase)
MDKRLNDMAKKIMRNRGLKVALNSPLNELSKLSYENAVNKGFHDDGINNLPTMLMHVVGELGEALEADRTERYMPKDAIVEYNKITDESSNQLFFKTNIKDTFEDEISDCFIRLFDLCGKMCIDIDSNVKAKMKYNASRPRLHGKKY